MSYIAKRRFTSSDVSPFDQVRWDTRDARIEHYATGEVAFEQRDIEVPKDWSQNATNIVAQKYFRGRGADRENSVRGMIKRVVDRYVEEGEKHNYFKDEVEKGSFRDELVYILLTQRATFNSPVWFNVGHRPPGEEQCSACFILSVEDDMGSILNWITEEGTIFKHGSGSGVNLSKLRSSSETLHSGGTASGPVSFMRGADASAGAIKSGGSTRRAAKMVILEVGHPDIREFIWCKALEERKARALKTAGFDMDIAGKDIHSVQYQNANNSVRVSNAFMAEATQDGIATNDLWNLIARTTGDVAETVKASEILREMAEAAWECADPGIQYDDTINDWHTCPNSGRINGSNPCSEYMHIDNSSCNLASINLLKFLGEDGQFDIDAFKHTVEVMFLAQEISISFAWFPTEKIAENSRNFRQIGLGYANLGALLMAMGLPYDSDDGRSVAAAITAIMTGHAYTTSAKIAERLGPFAAYEDNKFEMLRVIDKHLTAANQIKVDDPDNPFVIAAAQTWEDAYNYGDDFGYRNAQATVLAPTGTIGFMMDCDTTGIEPDLALKKVKKLVGGGTMSIVNHQVEPALRRMGYDDQTVRRTMEHIDVVGSITDAKWLEPHHREVFRTSLGKWSIDPMGHVRMMAAVQPFLSGAISKTINMPEESTVEDIEEIFIEGWRLGLKALAVYRDNCKAAQPVSSENNGAVEVHHTPKPGRRKPPRERASKTIKFAVAGTEGYLTLGEFDDGTLAEMFLRVAKQGSTVNNMLDNFAIGISLGLQHGVPLETYVKHFTSTSFEPAGITDDPDFRITSSILDIVFKIIALRYLEAEKRHELGIKTAAERKAELDGEPLELGPTTVPVVATGECCDFCGNPLVPNGSCLKCPSCGETTGCS